MPDEMNTPSTATSAMVSTDGKQIVISLAAIKTHAGTIMTGLLRIGGAWLATRGYMSPAVASNITPDMAQEAIGIVMVLAGQVWAHWRTQHQRQADGLTAALGNVIVIK